VAFTEILTLSKEKGQQGAHIVDGEVEENKEDVKDD
jgi:hypothetical protein